MIMKIIKSLAIIALLLIMLVALGNTYASPDQYCHESAFVKCIKIPPADITQWYCEFSIGMTLPCNVLAGM